MNSFELIIASYSSAEKRLLVASPFPTYYYLNNLYIYLVVVVGPVEMWKSRFIVVTKGIVFHSPCEKDCGKL
jgi:hypothetical protein